jgi:hypothetical protein
MSLRDFGSAPSSFGIEVLRRVEYARRHLIVVETGSR